MATYKEIVGQKITKVTSDPSDPKTGQMWYNSTDGNLRGLGILEAWSSASSTINAKQRPGGCGTQTAGLAAGGLTAPPASALGTTEEYNGSGWSSGGNLNTARGNVGMAGTQTAAVFSGKGSPGTPYAGTTELYDGTSWTTNPNSANDTYNYRSNCGIQTAALFTGGNYPPTNRAAGNEEFNGTSFSEGGDLPQKQSSQGQAGTQTAAINSFGTTNSPVPGNSGDGDNAISLEYDGTSWTAGPNGNGVVPLAGYSMGSGTQTDALFAGGPPTNSCKYDGTTFTVGPALATAQPSSAHGSSSASATWIAHGSPVPSVGTNTQEFNFSTNTFTAAAWASAPSIGTGRYLGGYGITPTNASIIFGGQSATGSVANTEEYNGSSWAENPDMNTARSRINGFGTQTAAVTMGGRQVGVPPNSVMNNTELYDGSSWTNGPAYPLTARGIGGAGTNAAGLAIAAWTGSPPGFTTCNDWNGSGWTAAEANLNTARGYVSGWGTQSDAGAAGGPPANTDYEEYNGSSWTTKASLVSATGAPSGGAAGFGGTPGAIKANGNGGTFSQEWNGTSWGTAVSRANTNYGGGMSGGNTAASGIVTGGYIYPSTGPATGSEEFTGETTALNVKTLTQS